MTPSRLRAMLTLVLTACLGLATGSSCHLGAASPDFRITSPAPLELVGAGPLGVTLAVPADAVAGTLELYLDGVTVPLQPGPGQATAQLPAVPAGRHELVAWVRVPGTGGFQKLLHASVFFDAMAVPDPGCEELNAVECMLPYPSSRFLAPASTPNGVRLDFPPTGMPKQNEFGTGLLKPTSPEPYRVLDGFSPTVQVLFHVPGGVDPALSGASRLLADRRGPDARSLDADSPTVLIDAETGERILHWIENDARATDPGRVVTFLRPGRSLEPGRRYIVALRDLKHPDGSPVAPEPAFRALRDGSPIRLASLEARRAHFEDVFARLESAGVGRDDLVLAFDFRVQSEHGLSHQMLSMRDQAFAWLAANDADPTSLFTVQEEIPKDDCSQGGFVWKEIRGTFRVPLFLEQDPITDTNVLAFLTTDEDGNPVWDGARFTNPPFTIAIPCAVLEGGGNPLPPMLLGHGLFGTGRGFVKDLTKETVFQGFDYVIGATDWRGLSQPDIDPLYTSFVVNQVLVKFNNFAALPDRLRQGMLNTLVLARLMRSGAFNAHPAFQVEGGVGVLADSDLRYFGASLGGIMGTFFAALTPDAERLNVDVPAINFSCMLQRATPFILFQDLLLITGLTDPMTVALGLSIVHELWVRGEPAGYATHVTSNPLPGSDAKQILMTEAWLDQQVSNQCTEIAARTLGLPSLVGSLRSGIPQIPDQPGPLPSAYVVYDTGSFDLSNPEHAPFIPPLANLQPTGDGCDPHGRRGFIPASIAQLDAFLQPGGQIVNFCSGPGGICDTVSDENAPSELPRGKPACDPLD